MKRRLVLALLVLGLVAGTIVASSTVAGASPSGSRAVTLKVWVPPVFTDANKAQLKRFQQQTGIKLDIQVFPVPFEQNLLSKWATGERPDILFFHAIGNWIVQLNPDKNLQRLDNDAFVKKTIPGILPKSSTFRGHTYAAIVNYPYIDGMFYNKQVFAKYNLKPPTNYKDLLALCKTIKQKAPEIAPIYAGGGDQWPLQVLAFEMWNDAIKRDPNLINKLNQKKAKFTDPAFLWGIQAEKNLKDAGCYNSDILTATFEGEQKALMSGQAAMVFQGTWMVGSLVDANGVAAVNKAVGFAGLSRYSNVVSWQTVGAGAVYAPKSGNKTREAAARRFIEFATGKDYGRFLKESKQFPILKGYPTPKNVPAPLVQANRLFLKNSVPQFQQTLQAAYGAFETFLQSMIAGKSTPQEVTKQLQSEFEKSARQVGLPGF